MNAHLTRRELILGAAALPALADTKKPAARPNVVLIALEDVGAWMLGSYGNRELRTPTFDLLARTGARFQNSYTSSVVPAPGLASLLTGQMPRQVGFTAGTPPASFDSVTMLSDVLSTAGYDCAFAGQWDLGSSSQPHRGFKSWEIAKDPDAVTAKAAQFLEGRKPGQPFVLVARYAMPEAGPSRILDSYQSTSFDTIGWEPISFAAANKDAFTDIKASLRKAASALTFVDEQVGVLLQKLAARGLQDETLVILTSSNGALLGRHGLWGDGLSTKPPAMCEEVVAVPLIWRWPSRVPPETIRPEFVGVDDLLPTLCELIDAPLTTRHSGRSYLPALLGKPFPKKQPWRSLVFAEYGEAVMARDKRFKLVLRGKTGPHEIYDEIADRGEHVNQYANPEFVSVRDGMNVEIANWAKSL